MTSGDKSSIREFKCPTCGDMFVLKMDCEYKCAVRDFEDKIYAHASCCAVGKLFEKMLDIK